MTNVKNRQTRAQDAGMDMLETMIRENNMMEHKVLLFLLKPGQLDANIAGLVANKLMAKYQRPVCVLTRCMECPIDETTGKKGPEYVAYRGSARGYDKSGVESFREILRYIDKNILPFINDKSTSGQDLLNLFFVTFNIYNGEFI